MTNKQKAENVTEGFLKEGLIKKSRIQELLIKAMEWKDEQQEQEKQQWIDKALKFLLNYDPNDYLEEIADFGVYELNEEKVKTAFYKAMEL